MGANSIQGQSELEEGIAERKMVSDLSNRIDDLKVDLEWYKEVSRLKNKSYYDSFNNSLGGAGKPLSSPVVLADMEHRQVKMQTVNSFLAETPESTEAMVNAKEAGEFTAVNVPSDVLQSQSSFLAISHLKNNWPMKIKIESGTNVCHLLLLIAALVSTITYRTALTIRACKLEQGFNYSSSLISICQIVDQHPLFIRLVMAFNSIAFFLSMALLMILFNELPLRPLLLVSAFSMLGAYICAITDLTKPT
ncbi:uncharacterized protein LOC102622424 isoform X1 [Citrus sinensis]|uniref:uncharacterized protein LOC102622424 isoform X1 n=1 Tax=Citrus sinensis TaxID=2711 RepID=UPI0022778741|nr:uncharacterized protein LOC102622424 isoform X1 [Citrus sinensis]